ncbi:hypothetical protein ACN47E_004059 [Coniothyrium glycines]
MDEFLKTQLHPAEICAICTEPFSSDHQPVALPCKHIFGYGCIRKWLKNGRGNTSACPTCRHVVFDNKTSRLAFDAPSVWAAMCEQPPERLHDLMLRIWSGLQYLWKRKADGNFTVTELLDKAIIPALLQTADHDVVLDSYNLIAASWDSLGRPDTATGLMVPFVRLARLMSSASTKLPKWMTTTPRANRLLWRANACIAIRDENVSWEMIVEAAKLENGQYFPLLHAYTMLLSQTIEFGPQINAWPTRRHEIMNLVVERCCNKIGQGRWCDRPSNQFKDMLVVVYEELRRQQLEKNKVRLGGHHGEEHIVRGLWALAGWAIKRSQSLK